MSWYPPGWNEKRRKQKPQPADEIEFLTVADVVALAAPPERSGPAEDVRLLGVRDMTALTEIVDQARKVVEARPGGGIPEVATCYFTGMIDLRPLAPGRNFVTAIKAVYLFALLNDWTVDMPLESWRPFLEDVATGDMSTEQVASVIAGFLRPR